jgi:peroxiredoxin
MGQPFPDLALRDLSGRTVRLRDLVKPGRRALVNLWATWCVPCAEEIPELQKLYPDLERSGVDLIGISVDLDTVEHVAEYVRDRGVGYPIYTTDVSAMETLFPRGEVVVPVTALLDEQGRVVRVYSGWSPESEEAIRGLVGR